MITSISVKDKPVFFSSGRQVCVFYPVSMERSYVARDEFNKSDYGVKKIVVNIPDTRLQMLQMNVTNKCNMSCEYCTIYKNSYVTSRATMSEETVDRLISQFYGADRANPPLVVIFGGEPMLAFKEVDHLVRGLPTETTKVLFTNGTIMQDEHIERFLTYGNFHIVVSLDGMPSSNDLLRHFRRGTSTTRIVKNLSKMHKYGLHYGISLVAQRHNIDNLVENVEFILRELSPSSLGVNLPHFTEAHPYHIDVAKYAEALIETIGMAREHGVFVDQINRRLKPFASRQIRFRDCAACGEKLVFQPDGSFSNCINYFGLLKDPYAWKDRIPILKTTCWDCYAVGVCGGGCIVDGIKYFGDNSFDERNCYVARRLVEDFVWRFQDESQVEKYACLLERRFHDGRFSVGHITD